jgi:hypothetical protein
VPPKLTIRPGHPVREIVTRDLVLEPQGGHRWPSGNWEHYPTTSLLR